MEAIFLSPVGRVTREATPDEVAKLAELGDENARLELFKSKLAGLRTDAEKLNLVIAFLTREKV